MNLINNIKTEFKKPECGALEGGIATLADGLNPLLWLRLSNCE